MNTLKKLFSDVVTGTLPSPKKDTKKLYGIQQQPKKKGKK